MENKQTKNKYLEMIIDKGTAIIGLIILVVALTLATDTFLTVNNLLNVLRQSGSLLVMAIGMTFVIISGGIDLSAGSQVAVSGVVIAGLMAADVPFAIAFLITLAVGAVLGTFIGAVVSYQDIQPFIVTLATTTIFSGLAFVYTKGTPISATNPSFRFIGTGQVAGIPFLVILMLVIGLLGHMVLQHTPFGRYVYALGDNEETARLSGVKIRRVRTMIYTLSGTLFALSGIIVASRLATGTPNAGTGSELDAIASVAIGGASMAGGSGTMTGTFVGVALMSILNNGLNLLNVSSYNQMMVKGLVILLAVWLNSRKSKKEK